MSKITLDPRTGTILTPFQIRVGNRLFRHNAYDVYVDSENGDDTASGALATQAVQSLAEAQARALAFGDGVRIGMAAGSEWRDTLRLEPLQGVSVIAYGDVGNNGLPRLRGDDDLSAGGWDDATDRGDANSSVYSRDVVTDGNGFPFVLEDEKPLVWVASVGDCQSTAGTYHIQAGELAAGTYTVYAHPRGSTDPRTDGKTYSYSRRSSPNIGFDNAIIDGAEVFAFVGRNGLGARLNASIRRVFFHYTSMVHDALPDSGEYKDCGGWSDVHFAQEGHIGFEFFTSDGAGHDVAWRRGFYVGVEDQVGNEATSATGGHTGGPLYETATISDFSAKNARVEITGLANQAVARRVKVDGKRFSLSGSYEIEDLWVIAHPTINDTNVGVALPNEAGTVNGLRIYGDYTTAGIAGASDLVLERSVFARSGDEFRGRVVWDNDATNVSMTGCAFDTSNGAFQDYIDVASYVGDNNMYGNINHSFDGQSYTTLAGLQGAGVDANSVENSANFADPANGDWTITGSNPPANSGLERPDAEFTTIPSTVAEARAQVITWWTEAYG